MSTPPSASTPPRPAFRFRAVFWLCVLLVLPALALRSLTAHREFLLGVASAVSGIAFLLYWSDKRRAERGAGRVPESTLQVAALLGGWPGAFLGQQVFRHKTAKVSFQLVFWSIVALHEYLAADALNRWSLTRALGRAIAELGS